MFAGLLCLAGSVCAQEPEKVESTVANLLIYAEKDKEFSTLIVGAGRALEGVSMNLKMLDRPQFYCAPENLVITGDQYQRILKGFIEKNPRFGKNGRDVVWLGHATSDDGRFPCK